MQLGQATSQLWQRTEIDDVRHRLWLSTGTQVRVDLSSSLPADIAWPCAVWKWCRRDHCHWERSKPGCWTEWVTVHKCSNQEARHRDKTPAHKISVQSLMASVGEPQVIDSTLVWYVLITESRLTRPIMMTWCCYVSPARYTSDLNQILHLSAGLCPGAHGA